MCPRLRGKGGGASHQRGKTPKWYVKYMTRCFSPPYFSFPLEGKCLEEAKGCTGLSRDMTLYHFPDRQSAAPPIEVMHSEPIRGR